MRRRIDPRDGMAVLWPSFLAAGLACMLIFALVDPLDVAILGTWTAGRVGFYTVTFFVLWAMAALSSALSLLLRPAAPDDDDL